MDSTEICALLQLQHAELARIRTEMSRLHESHGALRRMVGHFYDVGFNDALGTPGHRRRRHLRSLDD